MTVLGQGGYPKTKFGSFAGKVAFVPARSFTQTFTRLGALGVSRPPFGSFAGKIATIVVVPPPAVPAPFLFGGIGHLLYERELARKLAKITRKTPQPIDRRTQPTFAPIAGPPIAAAAPAPVLASMQNELMAGQMQAAAAKKKRDLEAILLLAS